MIYKVKDNIRAVQLLLGHAKIESTVRYVGIEVDDPRSISGQLNWERTVLCDTRMRVTLGWEEDWRFLAHSGLWSERPCRLSGSERTRFAGARGAGHR